MKATLLALGGALALACAASPASGFAATAPSTVTFDFQGDCADCGVDGAHGTAELVLRNYTPGAEISNANFVSFDYHSNVFDYDVDADNFLQASGDIDTPRAPYNFQLTASSDPSVGNTYYFSSDSAGAWSTGFNISLDQGDNGVWNAAGTAVSAAPEPGSWVLLLGGVGLLGAAFRLSQAYRRERSAAF